MPEKILPLSCTLLVLCACLLLSPALAANPACGSPEPRTITVSGEAQVKVVPDQVEILLGVETLDHSMGKAKQENDERVKKILSVARVLGLSEKQIATDRIEIEPRYQSYTDRREFLGYTVRKSVVLTLGDLSKFEALLTGILDAGANYVHGVQFRTTELRKHRDTARSLAIQAAKEKATALAKDLGQKVGAPRSITEGGSGWWSFYGGNWGYRGNMMSQNVVQNAGGQAAAGGDEVNAPGTISVNASVTVTFELE